MLELLRTSAEAPYTPCYLCAGVVRVGSMRVRCVQTTPNECISTLHTFICVVRVGSLRFDVPVTSYTPSVTGNLPPVTGYSPSVTG